MSKESCIIVGAGNAGRPVARLLNYKGMEVTIVDGQSLEKFTEYAQDTLKLLETEGIKLELGVSIPEDIEKYDYAYISPVIPKNTLIYQAVHENVKEIITSEYVSKVLNETLNMDIIGITGSVGKTTTTRMISNIFETAGYNILSCSSEKRSVLSEGLIEDIVEEKHKNKDVLILELPHGTINLFSGLKLKIGILIDLYAEHLNEFNGSMQKYVERKSIIMDSSEKFILNVQCLQHMQNIREDTICYALNDGNLKLNINSNNLEDHSPDFIGTMNDNGISVDYTIDHETKENLEVNLKEVSYNCENATGAIAVALNYGIDLKSIKKGITSFERVPGRLESLGMFNNREVYLDSSQVEEGIRQTLEFETFKNKKLTIICDNLNAVSTRDTSHLGKVIGEYADTFIAIAYVDVLETYDWPSAIDTLYNVENPDVKTICVGKIDEAGELAIRYSKPGDVIIHIGPAALSLYDNVKQGMIDGLKEGCKKYESE